ncbi:hypothetical protein EUGRSUZ_H03309 [Eucalyptus grandis]|uniref:Uncharacterized protein n=2 Tax=Eucalyptus grandis TaxID=71139 RepID=A0ACC3JYC5_EUCGR|nr:hypothetical protein EUGRSUZ_H03309 [Eucalyptus grandis]
MPSLCRIREGVDVTHVYSAWRVGEEGYRELLLTFTISVACYFVGEFCDLEKEGASFICQIVSENLRK